MRAAYPRRLLWVELLGWYGTLALIAAYLLVSFSILSGNGVAFQILNLTGGVALGVETYYHRDWQPLWLNAVWSLIALAALAQLIIRL